ncbi:MAG: hypothetical protein C0405_14900, partial [Desulfovibrio sp.]|nr:hypothetical protein [Desulfovibrio sp.]
MLDLSPEERQGQSSLVVALVGVNRRFGRGALCYAISACSDRPWHMRQQWRSPRDTTSWTELAKVRETWSLSLPNVVSQRDARRIDFFVRAQRGAGRHTRCPPSSVRDMP